MSAGTAESVPAPCIVGRAAAAPFHRRPAANAAPGSAPRQHLRAPSASRGWLVQRRSGTRAATRAAMIANVVKSARVRFPGGKRVDAELGEHVIRTDQSPEH